jgi:hypothetical protein
MVAGTGLITRLPNVTVIDLYVPWATCSICGADTVSRWGVPRHNGDLVSNAFAGEWGGSPACETCFNDHAAGRLVTYDDLYEGRRPMATEILCLHLDDDEDIQSAIQQAIADHDAPELVRVVPFNVGEQHGMWVQTTLAGDREVDAAKGDGRHYRDDGSGLEWIWCPDGTVTR